MAYSFKHVTIYCLDIHPAISLLKDPTKKYFQNEFDFLADAVAYETAYLGGKQVRTASFVFDPLPAHELKKSHFWKSIGSIQSKNGQPDFWGLQMPFVGNLGKADLKLNHQLSDVRITVVPAIYLSAIGWSVNLKIELKGNIKKSDLIDFVGWLSRGEGKNFSFAVGADLKDKKEVFRFLNNLVLSEIYKKENPPHPGMKIISHIVISINSFDGDITGFPDMPSDEKALMRSILFGRNIDPLNLSKEDSNSPLVKTQITANFVNFSLTNFEVGTLIFLQREARNHQPVNKENKQKVICFTENCKNCLMTSFLIWQFYSLSGQSEVDNDLGKLKKNLALMLKQIPENFPNLFCKNLFLQHKQLASF
jgi:hypothetical protein